MRSKQLLTWVLLGAGGALGSDSVCAGEPIPAGAVEDVPLAEVESLGAGKVTALSVFPAKVSLRGADRQTRLVVTGICDRGGVRDVTLEAAFRVSDPTIASVDSSGIVRPTGDGETVVEVTLPDGGVRQAVTVLVSEGRTDLPVSFPNDVVPVFSKHGCNAGGCHGKSGGQNGFQLSLFGFTPSLDYTSITRESRGRRVFPAAAERSLLLRKPSGGLPHGGGLRFEPGSPDHHLLLRWIRQGLPYGKPDDPVVRGISVYPRARILAGSGRQQLAVTAHLSDGRAEDVTARAQYVTGDTDYLEANPSGLVSARGLPGQGAVMVRYLGHVAVFRATIPSGLDISKHPFPANRGYIDEHVFQRLSVLGIPPSELAGDTEFLRRASIDVRGSLPSASEAAAFLADPDPDKRLKLIDRLIDTPEYASYFALRWADLLRNRRGNEDRAAPITIAFHRWILESFLVNRPLDEFVREIICAEGSVSDTPQVAWYRSLEGPKQLVDDTAQVFLGTRIQCARCHHHPFEKWGQDDYWSFANFFSRTVRKNDSNSRVFTVYGRRGESRFTDDEPTSASFQKTYRGLKLPGGPAVEETSEDDPRETLAAWLVSPENGLFAKAAVNRYWKHFFGRGIVEPEDDFRETNPPSNPRLLDALARDFAESGHDLKRLVRTILSSATYQLSSVPNAHNVRDRQSFSRYLPRRLGAEVLLDALDQFTGRKTRFRGVLRGARAIDLPDESAGSYFLEVFGKPERQSSCSCERSSDVTLPQVVHLLNSREVGEKISSDGGRAALLAKDPRDLDQRIEELFLSAFSRPPSPAELLAARAQLAPAAGSTDAPGSSRKAWEDLVWTLLNTKEFFFER